jgi:hypothetical protein
MNVTLLNPYRFRLKLQLDPPWLAAVERFIRGDGVEGRIKRKRSQTACERSRFKNLWRHVSNVPECRRTRRIDTLETCRHRFLQ